MQLPGAFATTVHVRRSEVVRARPTDDGTARFEFTVRDQSRLFGDEADLEGVVGCL